MSTEVSVHENATEPISPDTYLDYSKVVAETLRMLNGVIQAQQQSITAIAVNLSRATIRLVKDANSVAQADTMTGEAEKSIEDRFRGTLEELEKATKISAVATSSLVDPEDLKDANPPAPAYYAATGQALNDAYFNAVNAQQQLNLIAQATLAQGIAFLYSIVAASLGKAEAETLMRMAESLNPGSRPQADE